MATKCARHLFFGSRYSLRVAFISSVSIFVVLLGTFFWVTCWWTSYQATVAVRALDRGVAIDRTYLVDQGDAIAGDPHFVQVALERDPDKLVSLLKEERDKRNIGLMGFADQDGVIISRTRTSSSTGENTFVVSPQGRALARGVEHVSSVEMSSFDPTQLLITTGRYVYDGGNKIGALFTNRLMDDEYANRFSEQYLPGGNEILFYTRSYGIYGSSIPDTSLRQIILSYFNTDSDWIRSGRTGTMIKFDGDHYYQIRNIVFAGLEGGSSGGALILVPYRGYSTTARSIFAIISLIVFAVIVHNRCPSKQNRNRYYYGAVFTFGVLLCIVMFVVSRSTFVPYSQLRIVPYVLYNSTLRLQPEAGVFDIHYERPITILLDTGSEHINAISTILSYDPELVSATDIDVEDSLCAQYIERTIDTVNNQVRIACVLPSPGFSGSSGKVATVIFKPSKIGTSDIRFADETMVLANDGLGTNVLRSATNGNYRFVDNIGGIGSASSSAGVARDHSLTVYSPSHPNGGRWYSSRNIQFSWVGGGTEDFMYTFDQTASSTLQKGISIKGLNAEIQAPDDGIFYFHIAPIVKGVVGPISDYKIMIDTAPPSEVMIRSSADRAEAGDVVRFEFDAQDERSGLQNTMYLDIDDSNLFLPVGRQVYVPFVDPGSIPVRLRVYDKAGNYVQVEKTIEVSGKPGQWLMKLTH